MSLTNFFVRGRKNEIASILWRKGHVFRSLIIFTSLINILMLAPSIYMMQVYDRVLPSRNIATLVMLTVIILGLYTLLSLLEYIRSMVVIRLSNNLDMQLNTRVYDAAYQHGLANGPQDMAGQALNDLTALRQFLTGNSLFAFLDAPWFPIYLLVIFLFNVWMGLLALGGVVVLVALAMINDAVTHKPLSWAGALSVASGQEASSRLRNADVIAAMGMLPDLQSRWLRLHRQFLASQSTASERASLIMAISKGVRLALQSLVLGVGSWLAIEGAITPGMMIAGSILMGRVLSPVEQAIGAWKNWRGAKAAWQRLNTLLEAHPAAPDRLALPPPRGALSVEGISSAALSPEAQPVLRDIRFEVQPGDALAIVGPSAAGKSLLMRAIAGVSGISRGVIRLDGADISQWDRQYLGPHVGYLPQEVGLFAGTVAQNIARFGEPDADATIAAARLAGVHEMILRLPQGYDTLVTGMLSGGQAQRIGLARALYGNPALILLDEPNASLDDAGEAALALTISRLRQMKKTVLVITHRPALLAIANMVLVLNNGAISAWGPTRQVLEAAARQHQPGKMPEAQATKETIQP